MNRVLPDDPLGNFLRRGRKQKCSNEISYWPPHHQGEIHKKTECMRTVNFVALHWVRMTSLKARVIFRFCHAEKADMDRLVPRYLIRTDGKVTKLTSRPWSMGGTTFVD